MENERKYIDTVRLQELCYAVGFRPDGSESVQCTHVILKNIWL